MRNHTRIAAPVVGNEPSPKKRASTARARISRRFGSIIEWLREGYPDEAPRTGHSPLLALNGPMALSAKQTARIVAELGEATDSIDIAVTVAKVTNQMPTPTQTRSVTRALRPHA